MKACPKCGKRIFVVDDSDWIECTSCGEMSQYEMLLYAGNSYLLNVWYGFHDRIRAILSVLMELFAILGAVLLSIEATNFSITATTILMIVIPVALTYLRNRTFWEKINLRNIKRLRKVVVGATTIIAFSTYVFYLKLEITSSLFDNVFGWLLGWALIAFLIGIPVLTNRVFDKIINNYHAYMARKIP